LNGGFGKSYNILREDLLIQSPLTAELVHNELYCLSEIASLDPDFANLVANRYFHGKSYDWELSGLDAFGFDFSHKEHSLRVELDTPAQDIKGLIAAYKRLLMEIREN
jgi:hypothetical protein